MQSIHLKLQLLQLLYINIRGLTFWSINAKGSNSTKRISSKSMPILSTGLWGRPDGLPHKPVYIKKLQEYLL